MQVVKQIKALSGFRHRASDFRLKKGSPVKQDCHLHAIITSKNWPVVREPRSLSLITISLYRRLLLFSFLLFIRYYPKSLAPNFKKQNTHPILLLFLKPGLVFYDFLTKILNFKKQNTSSAILFLEPWYLFFAIFHLTAFVHRLPYTFFQQLWPFQNQVPPH